MLRHRRMSAVHRPFSTLAVVTVCHMACSAAGCGAGGQGSAEVARAVFPNIPDGPTHDAPARGWADHYGGGPHAAALSGREKEILDAVRLESGGKCAIDGLLTVAARYHAEDIKESRAAGKAAHMDRLRFTLHRLGAYDYIIEPITAALDPMGRASFVDRISRSASDWTHCGLGIAGFDEDALAVWLGARRAIHLDPLPIALGAPSTISVTGDLNGALDKDIKIFLGLPDQSVQEISRRPVSVSDRFAFDISLAATGRYDIELLVDSGNGFETVALLPLFVGVEPDPRPIVSPHFDDPSDEAQEEILFRHLNAARAKAGRRTLERDARLDEIARGHSEDMAQNGFFGHVSPTESSLKRRLEKRDLSPAEFAENIAMSHTLHRIHHNLMMSPSHRIVMLNPAFTHVGIGTARHRGEIIATQVYAAW